VATLVEFINRMPLAGLMLVTAIGFTIGRLQFRGMSLGPAGGTLFAALPLGYLGVNFDALYGDGPRVFTIGTFGFVLFIYSVGFEAGPRFFSSIRDNNGWKFISLGLAVNVLALALCLAWSRFTNLDEASTAGMLAGSLTSAPTFAAASQMGIDGTRLSVAFAITYPIGLIGVVLMIQLLPRLLRQNLTSQVRGDSPEDRPQSSGREDTRAFEIKESACQGVPLKDLNLTHRSGAVLTLILRAGKLIVPDGDTELKSGDRALARGHVDQLHQLERLLGSEIEAEELLHRMPPTRRILVAQGKAFGKTLAELNLIRRFHGIVLHIERASEKIDPDADVRLLRHDVLVVAGAPSNVKRMVEELGDFEPSAEETNIAIYTGGIFLGLLIGSFHLHPLGLDFTPGMAAGLLLSGLILGWAGRIGRYTTHVPKPARQLVRDLGILLFIGETGIEAGANLMEGLSVAPWQTLTGAAIISTFTVLASLFFALKFLRLKPLDSWGAICGGLTSSAALHALRQRVDSNEITISYAAAYAIGSVAATLAGQLIVIWLR